MVWHLHLAHVAFLWVVKRYSAACIHRKKLRAFHQTLVAAVVLLALAISLCSLLSPAYAIQTVAFASATMAVIILPVCTAVLVYMYGKTAHELQGKGPLSRCPGETPVRSRASGWAATDAHRHLCFFHRILGSCPRQQARTTTRTRRVPRHARGGSSAWRGGSSSPRSASPPRGS